MQYLFYLRHGADTKYIVCRRLIIPHIALRNEKDILIFPHGLVERYHGFFAANIKMQDHAGENSHAS